MIIVSSFDISTRKKRENEIN